MLLDQDTYDLQKQLAEYCRDGKSVEIDGTRAERLPQYRRLVFNVMFGIVEKAFPIMRSILEEADFRKLVEIYLSKHEAQESQVWKVPGEFASYFQQHPPLLLEDHPYLIDLMKLEWMEILVYNRENREIMPYIRQELHNDVELVLNPECELVDFNYPVFRGSWDLMQGLKSTYHLMVFRNPFTFKVHFMEVSPLHIVLLEKLKKGKTVDEGIRFALDQFRIDDQNAGEILQTFILKLYSDGYILGQKLQ